MQRLHEEDFTGYLLETDSKFKHIKIPAIAESNEIWKLKNNKTVKRLKGEALHPARESLDKLIDAKKQMGEYNFAGQYQQNPAPRDGGIIKRKWFRYYNPKEFINAINNNEILIKSIFQSWDTASKIEQYNDYSVCLTVLRDTNDINYVLDCYREKLEFPNLVKKVVQLNNFATNKYNHRVDILIEDKNSGIQLIQTLRNEHNLLNIKDVKPEVDKQTRLMSVSYLIENGSCLFPNDNPHWLYEFEHELLSFPNSKHDDQCDALSQLLAQPSIISIFDVL